jgi:two-component system, cell cycle sensor histidine kinase and response regulator CckA
MKARILVVEDESIVQLDLESRLQRLGYAVVGLAASGEEAVAKAAALQPDLVLMDVRLEGPMDGIEAARQIRAARDVPVLFLTAHAASLGEQEQVALRPCLSKPFRAAELQTAMAQVLDCIGTSPSQEKQAESS